MNPVIKISNGLSSRTNFYTFYLVTQSRRISFSIINQIRIANILSKLKYWKLYLSTRIFWTSLQAESKTLKETIWNLQHSAKSSRNLHKLFFLGFCPNKIEFWSKMFPRVIIFIKFLCYLKIKIVTWQLPLNLNFNFVQQTLLKLKIY